MVIRLHVLVFLLATVCVAAYGQDRPGNPAFQSFTYKNTKQADLQLIVHYPPGWKETDKRPTIVFFFGGGWTGGNIEQFEPQANHLASRGMVAVRADYRVKSRHGVTPKECVEDAKSAVRWMRQNAAKLGVDPERIVAAGGSAGGHIAACTAFTPGLDAEDEDAKISSKPNALVLFNPVLRLHRMDAFQVSLGYLPPTGSGPVFPVGQEHGISLTLESNKPEDRVEVKCDGDGATLVVFSQSGIGRATLTSTNGNWPTTVILHLHLAGLEHFAVSTGKGKLTGSVLSHSGNTARLFLTEDGNGEKRELETDIKVFDANGKPAAGLPGKGGHFEITLPKALLTSQPKCLELEWIDFYRG